MVFYIVSGISLICNRIIDYFTTFFEFFLLLFVTFVYFQDFCTLLNK